MAVNMDWIWVGYGPFQKILEPISEGGLIGLARLRLRGVSYSASHHHHYHGLGGLTRRTYPFRNFPVPATHHHHQHWAIRNWVGLLLQLESQSAILTEKRTKMATFLSVSASPPPFLPLLTCRATTIISTRASTPATQQQKGPEPLMSLPQKQNPPKAVSLTSLTCNLECPHFQSCVIPSQSPKLKAHSLL